MPDLNGGIMESSELKKTVYKVSVNTVIVNVVLSLFKFIAGIIASSGAMISDAVHSASDVFSTFIVMIGAKMSSKKPDPEHPYGHERFECVSAILLAAVLCVTGVAIGYGGVMKILSPTEALPVPGTLALIAAAVSVVVKEGMFHYTKSAAKKVNSGALMADAWHRRSDAFSSVGSFIGILGARLGLKILDPIASVVICLLIVKASYDIFKDSIDKMTDRSCDRETVEKLRKIILSVEGVITVDMIKTRLFGNRIYVDVEIGAKGEITLEEAHGIAERAHDAIEAFSPDIKHCMVHVNPK